MKRFSCSVKRKNDLTSPFLLLPEGLCLYGSTATISGMGIESNDPVSNLLMPRFYEIFLVLARLAIRLTLPKLRPYDGSHEHGH